MFSAAEFKSSLNVIVKRADSRVVGYTILAFAVLLGLIFRIYMAFHALNYDEYASIFFASQPLNHLWGLWMARETNPPLYYTILKGWMELPVPMGTALLRLPSIIAGVLAIPVVFAGVKINYGPRAAVFAALMVTVSQQQVFYAVDARCYSFLFLFLSVSFFGILSVISSNDQSARSNIFGWIAYGGGAVVAIYLHTTAFLWPAIATLGLMIVEPKFRPIIGKRWLEPVAVNIVVLVCVSWWLYVTTLETQVPNKDLAWMQYSGLGESLKLFFSNVALAGRSSQAGHSSILKTCLGISILALAIFGVIRSRTSTSTRMIVVCWIIAVVVYLTLSHKQNIILERTVLWMALFPITLAAAGVGSIRGSLIPSIITFGMALLLFVDLIGGRNQFEREDWRTPIVTIAQDKKGALIVDGEDVAVLANTACMFELQKPSCPFPIVTTTWTGTPSLSLGRRLCTKHTDKPR